MFRPVIFFELVFVTCCSASVTEFQEIRIDFNNPVNTDIVANGVQWSAYPHADSKDAEWGALMTPVKWSRVYQRLDYIRPGIVRVMDQAGWRYFKGLDQAGNPILDFGTEQVKALFRVLDYCQKNNVEVIFGEWGAPGFWGEPGHIDRSDDSRWIHMITRYLDFLINKKGYSCIKYYNLVNEPNGYWASTNGDWAQWKKGIQMLNDSICAIGLKNQLHIAGPDVVVVYDNPASVYTGMEWIDETIAPLDSVIGVYDVHAYPDGEFVRSGEFGKYYGYISRKVKPTGKKLILGELGLKYIGALYSKNRALAEADPNASKDDSNMFVYEYFYGLDVVDALIQAMNSSLEGAIAWDLDDAMHTQDDQGDKTRLKRWGMWNSLGIELCNNAEDENLRPWFYTWSLMCRFFPSGMNIAQSKVPERCPVRVVAGLLDGSLSIAVLNNSEADQTISLKVIGMPAVQYLFRYLYINGKRTVDKNGFPIPNGTIKWKNPANVLCVPAKSFLLLTNLKN
ncbi:MAG: hypothetical protein M0P47_13180 [Bacteroidales bacterium]|nr:hypothetical protein [Bacteroidales bacterium]